MNLEGEHQVLTLNGSDLSLDALVKAARDPTIEIRCAPDAMERVERGRQHIEQLVQAYEKAWRAAKGATTTTNDLPLIYGVTTGFGEFKTIPIPPEQLLLLQRNVLLSHSTGVGSDPSEENLGNYLPADVVRSALILRLNTFLKGNSGVRVETIHYIKAMLKRGIVPLVPLRGSLGSSGDLCPLAHLFATLLGKGRYYVVFTRADVEAPAHKHEIRSALDDLKSDLAEHLEPKPDRSPVEWPYEPRHKEGLALTNGAAFSAAILALAVHDSEVAASVADLAAALSFEALGGRVRCLDRHIHDVRPLAGQKMSATNLRELLAESEEVERAEDVQVAYSLRCAPQVHGATRDAIAYARMVIDCEINAATDNPLFFPGETPWDLSFPAAKEQKNNRDEHAYSAGNFHGQPVGLAADFLAIGVAELANISERRTQMLLDKHHNRGLPANLISNRGVNSGLMIAQYSAASLVSENKVLTHPASVDSIPSSANSEDHVAMAMLASRKLRDVLNNVQAVLAIELLCVVQAIDWRAAMRDPSRPEAVGTTPALAVKSAQEEAKRFRETTSPKNRAEIAGRLGRGTRAAYLAVRDVVEPITEDCALDGPIRMIWQIVRNGSLVTAVQDAMGHSLQPIAPLCSSAETAE